MNPKIKIEKDRAATEAKLLDTIGRMITEKGFEKIGINAVAKESGVSKILIYRYFSSVEGLMAAYVQQHDFWINYPHEIPPHEDLSAMIKGLFRKQIEQIRKDRTLKKLYRWELSSNNETIQKLREQREETGLWMVEIIGKLANHPQKEVAAIASIINAAITYLAMMEDSIEQYIGINLNEDSGWEQINQGIEILIDKWLGNTEKENRQ